MERVQIQPAGVAQVHRSLRTGKRVLVDSDVQQIAQDLHAIRDTLKLEYDPAEEAWIVFETIAEPDGAQKDKLVTTWDVEKNGPLDQRLVLLVRQIAHPSYDFAAELERLDAKADRDRAHRFREQVGPAAERLAHALRKDLGMNSGRTFVPKGIGARG